MLCVQIMWAAISIIGMLFMQPTDPQKANPRTVVQLQQFSWTEASLEDCIQVSDCCKHCRVAAITSTACCSRIDTAPSASGRWHGQQDRIC